MHQIGLIYNQFLFADPSLSGDWLRSPNAVILRWCMEEPILQTGLNFHQVKAKYKEIFAALGDIGKGRLHAGLR
jgi:hypothetical protein